MKNYEQDVFNLVVLNHGEFAVEDDEARHTGKRRPDAEYFLNNLRIQFNREQIALNEKQIALNEKLIELNRLEVLQKERYGLDS